MALGHLTNTAVEELQVEVCRSLPYGEDWWRSPHELLGGDSPEERTLSGDLESVRGLLLSILHVGIS